jgi:predicted membrane protein
MLNRDISPFAKISWFCKINFLWTFFLFFFFFLPFLRHLPEMGILTTRVCFLSWLLFLGTYLQFNRQLLISFFIMKPLFNCSFIQYSVVMFSREAKKKRGEKRANRKKRKKRESLHRAQCIKAFLQKQVELFSPGSTSIQQNFTDLFRNKLVL